MMTRWIISALFLMICSAGSFGQSLWSYDEHDLSLKMPEVSLVTVMPVNYTVNLSLGFPEAAGAKPGEADGSVDDNTWLNYSSSLRRYGAYRKVYVQVTSGSIPNGVNVELEVKNLRVAGRGRWGNRYRKKVILSNKPQVVIHRIGGGCTRRGKSFGHQLIYRLKLDNIDDLAIKEPKTYLTVAYTISD